ncbi:MAG: DUF423 domain-containing protein [Planctomycetota bacterium]
MKANYWVAIGGLFGAIGIGIGAFGAHGLPAYLAEAGFEEPQVARRVETFETGARFHLYAAMTLLAVGVAKGLWPGKAWSAAGWLLLLGGVLFSHSLYGLAVLEGAGWLGPVTPLGGLLTIAGWLAIAAAAVTSGNPEQKWPAEE